MPRTSLDNIGKVPVMVVVQGEHPALYNAGGNIIEKILERFLFHFSRRGIENVDLPLAHHERVDGTRVLARHVHGKLQVL
jgi:hypothetical protein